MKESDNIKNNNDGEADSSELKLQFTVFTENPTFHLFRIKEVMLSISAYDEENWPSDDQWDVILPNWFVKKIKSHTLDEIIKHSSELWDYGSWLDAIKYRGWRWFSSKIYIDKFIIILIATEFPYSVNPIEYLIFESGINLSKIHFLES